MANHVQPEAPLDIEMTDCAIESDLVVVPVNPVPRPTSKRKKGRPRKYNVKNRKLLALLSTVANNTLRAAGRSLALVKEDGSLEASHRLTSTCIIELALMVYEVYCQKLAESVDLLMMIDGSGTGTSQRSFVLVHFGGMYQNKLWSAPFGLLEVSDKGAQVDLAVVRSVLHSGLQINNF